jgi:hypothetical protein
MPCWRRRQELETWARDHAFSPKVEPPGDWPARFDLGTSQLLPLWHGDYSIGLSATFAAVNGLRLATAGYCPLSKRDEQRLLARAWSWRGEREKLRPDHGLRQGDWVRMVEALCSVVARRHGQFIRVWQPWRTGRPDLSEFYTTLERLIVGHHVVLSLFAGAHYSVIRGYTPGSLLLFDSGERCWMSRKCISVAGSGARGRHRIVPAATIALRRCN